MSPVEYFFGCLQYTKKSVLSVYAQMGFYILSLPSSREKLIWSFWLLLWNYLLILKNCSVSCIKFVFWLSFALIGRFFPVYIHSRIFGTIFRITGRLRNNFCRHMRLSESRKQALWRGLLQGISQLVSDCVEASRNLILDFLHKKTIQIVKTISAHSKSTV